MARLKVKAENKLHGEPQPPPEAARPSSPPGDDQLELLRQLLLGKEQAQIKLLDEKVNDPVTRTQIISEVLPGAITQSVRQDKNLQAALMDTVVEIIRTSVKKDIKTFADALFPVMGPAIRKYIAESFKEMVQSLNTVLDNSFSRQGLQWRLESIRTGRSFGEIVLTHSLVYRVEQVFLIHRNTGLVIKHLCSDPDIVRDADLVSAMLTAIRDFVSDSFATPGGDSLESIQVGEFNVWIEQGPEAILACAIRGTPVEALRRQIREKLENIHGESSEELQEFNGDSAVLEHRLHDLDELLQTRLRQDKETSSGGSPKPLLIALGVVLALLLGWWYLGHVEQSRLQGFARMLMDKPGLVVHPLQEVDGKTLISGLRDPVADDPVALLRETAIEPDSVLLDFEPYLSLEPEMLLRRAQTALQPPETVRMEIRDQVLHLSGCAPYTWIRLLAFDKATVPGIHGLDRSALVNADLAALSPPAGVRLDIDGDVLRALGEAPYLWIRETSTSALEIPGIARFDSSGLHNTDLQAFAAPNTVQLEFNGERVIAVGKAPYAWILASRKTAGTIPNIHRFDESKLQNTDLERLELPEGVSVTLQGNLARLEGGTDFQKLRELETRLLGIAGVDEVDASGVRLQQEAEYNELLHALRTAVVYFEKGEAMDFLEQGTGIREIAGLYQSLQATGELMGYPGIMLQVLGHTDASGGRTFNLELSQQRADHVKSLLIEAGIAPDRITALGTADTIPVIDASTPGGYDANRSVTFRDLPLEQAGFE